MDAITQKLFSLQDTDYRDFQCRLMPTVSPDVVIGVRIPALRKLAKEIFGTDMGNAFLAELPHSYYEENNLHGYMLELLPKYDQAVAALDVFLPYVDNWATCDTICPKIFRKNLAALWEDIGRWIASGQTYTIRFGLGMLMRYYLDAPAFSTAVLERAAAVESDEYYVNMMAAWFFATALTKQYEAALPYLTGHRLSPWVHDKAIQKAIESRQIAPEKKDMLKTLKLKRRT
jgi:3-methyladenine DNA glycosylase AlkD